MKLKLLAIVIAVILPVTLLGAANDPARHYGPVKTQDTLWSIADHARPDNSISVQQMMVAIRDYNPQAFVNGDMHALQKGANLYLPTLADIRANKSLQSATKTQLHQAITSLRSRLTQEQQRSQQLAKQLQAEQQHSRTLQSRLKQLQAAKVQAEKVTAHAPPTAEPKLPVTAKTPPVATPPTSSNPAVDQELASLRQLLVERDTHIQNLQASLREASIAIKRQYAESVALHQQLKAIDPTNQETIPPPPADINADGNQASKPGLTLEAAPETTQPPVNTTSNNAAPPSGMSVKSWLEQQAANQPSSTQATQPLAATPSRVSIVIALLSLLFIAALWWRSYAQQRALKREEAALRATLTDDDLNNSQPLTVSSPTTPA